MSFIETLNEEECYECDCESEQEALYDDSSEQLEFMEEGKYIIVCFCFISIGV